MIQVCDDCFEEFETSDEEITVCPTCLGTDEDRPDEVNGYTLEQCAHIFKCFCSCGFKSDEQIKEYQKVKKAYKKLRGRDLPQITENGGKNK